MSGRSTFSCPLCGRLICADHNLSRRNFDSHIKACPQQQAERAVKASRRYRREQARYVRRARMGEVPLPG